MTEPEIKRVICEYLEATGKALFTVHQAGRYGYQSRFIRKGWPDISGSYQFPNGTVKPLAIEVKKPGGRVRPEQREFLARAIKMGWLAILATSLDDVLTALRNEEAK